MPSLKKIPSDFLLSKKMTKNQWLDNRLVDLAPLLVPNKFQQEAPQFYDLIRSFLMHIQRVQDSINQDHRPRLNIKEIDDKEVLELYRKSYLQALKRPDESIDILLIKEILEVSKDLSQRKGTYFLFYLLTNILFYLIPQIKTQYQELIDQLKDESLSQSRRESLLKQINDYKLANPSNDLLEVIEESKMNYTVELNYPTDIFISYIYPFAHPVGWLSNIGAKLLLKFEDEFLKRDGFKISSIYLMKDHTQHRNNIIRHPENLISIVDKTTTEKRLLDPNKIINIDNQNYIDVGIIHPQTFPTLKTDLIWKDEDDNDSIKYEHKIFTNKNLNMTFDMNEQFYNTWIKSTENMYKVGTNALVGSGLIVGGNNQDGQGYQFTLEEINISQIEVA